MAALPQLRISSVEPPLASTLLQSGIACPVTTGLSVRDIITKELCIDPDYLEARILTIFLNGHAVDNMDSSILRDKDVLALSGAMPGVAGATMRRGGVYARMRAGITHCSDQAASASGARQGTATVKLFNVLIKEVGPLLMARGFVLSSDQLPDFLASYLPDNTLSITMPDGQVVDSTKACLDRLGDAPRFLVTATTDG